MAWRDARASRFPVLRMDRKARIKESKEMSNHPMSPAERTAALLAFRKGGTHNYAPKPISAKPVALASSRFKTA